MKYSALSTKNPECDLVLFKKYQALYEGGKLFKSCVKSFLTKNQLENQIDNSNIYDLRVKEASYRSFVGPIIDFFASQLFSSPYSIRAMGKEIIDPFYAEFKEDVDLIGTDLTSFMKYSFIESLIKRKSYWMVELPNDNGEEPANLPEWQERNLGRAKLCKIPTECVLDWEYDEYGEFSWVVIHYLENKRISPDSTRDIITETWKVLDKEKVEVYQLKYTKKQPPKPETIIPLIDSYLHKFDKVPLINICLPEGLWLLNRAADAQIEHFRLSAALGWSLRRSAYAMGIFSLKDKDSIPTTGAGYGVILSEGEDFKFAEPTGSSFSILQNEIKNQRDEIYRITNQMAQAADNNAAALGRSAESKNADQAATEIILHAYADIVKEAIEKTFELISDARGEYDLKFSIEGMNKFHLQDAETLVNTVKSIKELNIQSETLMHELDYRVAEASLPWDTAQDVKDKIRKEIYQSKNVISVVEDSKSEKTDVEDNKELNQANSLSNLNGLA